ncbi:MAG: hypothetical protein DLM59_06770 [Pseudonocardiales bacterium]|nr:MAG: hypothetical protein DLM59_06770 [Pseudonocardiales bacterium]
MADDPLAEERRERFDLGKLRHVSHCSPIRGDSGYLFTVEVRAELDADPSRVADARRVTEGTLTSWGLGDLGYTAALLVSELVTNAILHAHSGVVLTFRHSSDEVRIDVFDTSPLPPRVRHFRADAGTGRGVRLLDSLASSWGIARTVGGKIVWFTLSTGPQTATAAWEFDFDSVEPL